MNLVLLISDSQIVKPEDLRDIGNGAVNDLHLFAFVSTIRLVLKAGQALAGNDKQDSNTISKLPAGPVPGCRPEQYRVA